MVNDVAGISGEKKSHWRYTNARAFQIIDNMENQKKTTRIRMTVFCRGGLTDDWQDALRKDQ